MQKTFEQEVLFELHFWLEILKDHSSFIHDSLAPSETAYIEEANAFKERFTSLLATSKEEMDEQSILALTKEAKEASEEIRAFKLTLIQAHLIGDIKISLTPSFLNHMVNEVEEAIRLFSYFEKGEKAPPVHPLHHDLLWLLDAAGHAGAINADMDGAEKQLKKKSHKFTKEWEAFYLKAVEMAGYLRTNVMKFPALRKFHNDINLEMTIFKAFLDELKEMELNKEALGTFTAQMADHMMREETYYLLKLSETTDIPPPKGDPTRLSN
ncbi:DUF2935 domain-containing protein [Sporosarcina ureilytica]|uniref:DUF2935 domain-containing protein n=1 Tax=Sporosarcina ureilytica TaxID=298596 RepID=UPI000AD6E606|nr:DUF2935 domain-containing protein [Sporosarcina ureilytica]